MKEVLKEQLAKAKAYIYEIEDLCSTVDRCEAGYYYNKKCHFKTTLAYLALIPVTLFCWSMWFTFVGDLLRNGTQHINGFGDIAVFVGILTGPILAFVIIKALRKGYKEEMDNCARTCSQCCEHLQSRIDEDIQCVAFIPETYQNGNAISYIEEAIRTEAAKDLNDAIQQYHVYANHAETQMALAEQTARIESELQAIRTSIDYHY